MKPDQPIENWKKQLFHERSLNYKTITYLNLAVVTHWIAYVKKYLFLRGHTPNDYPVKTPDYRQSQELWRKNHADFRKHWVRFSGKFSLTTVLCFVWPFGGDAERLSTWICIHCAFMLTFFCKKKVCLWNFVKWAHLCNTNKFVICENPSVESR